MLTDAAIWQGLSLTPPAGFNFDAEGSRLTGRTLYQGPGVIASNPDAPSATSFWTPETGLAFWFDVVAERQYSVPQVRDLVLGLLEILVTVDPILKGGHGPVAGPLRRQAADNRRHPQSVPSQRWARSLRTPATHVSR